MAKSKQMELVKGVSSNQHFEIHSIIYHGSAGDRQASVQFARWGSKASFLDGEEPVAIYAPMVMTGNALKTFKKQGNLSGAAWAMLDLVLTDQIPANFNGTLSLSDRNMASDMAGSQLSLDPGEQPFMLDMSQS